MNVTRGSFLVHLVAASGLLAFCAGCYKPEADINAFRPQAEKYFADLEKVGKAVAAQPPVTQDTMALPNLEQVRFADGPGGKQNAQVVGIDELSNFGQPQIVDRVVSFNGYHAPAWALLHGEEDPHVGKVTKEVVPWRFHQLLDIQYLVVLRVKKVYGEVTNEKEFTGGSATGDAILCEVNDGAALHGGFPFAVQSSSQVSVMVHGDAAQQAIDRRGAVFQDVDDQAEKLIHQKVKSSLPGAGFPSYW